MSWNVLSLSSRRLNYGWVSFKINRFKVSGNSVNSKNSILVAFQMHNRNFNVGTNSTANLSLCETCTGSVVCYRLYDIVYIPDSTGFLSGNIDVSDGFWRLKLLATICRCWRLHYVTNIIYPLSIAFRNQHSLSPLGTHMKATIKNIKLYRTTVR